jgi:hypothetical protein
MGKTTGVPHKCQTGIFPEVFRTYPSSPAGDGRRGSFSFMGPRNGPLTPREKAFSPDPLIINNRFLQTFSVIEMNSIWLQSHVIEEAELYVFLQTPWLGADA